MLKRFYSFGEALERGRAKVSIRYKQGDVYYHIRFYRDSITEEEQAILSEYTETGLDPTVIEELTASRRATLKNA